VPYILDLFNRLSSSAFTLAAIRRSSVRHHPTVVYQTAWIVGNCLTLVLGRGLDWVTHAAGLPTINCMADWTCRIWQALFGIVRYVGGWTVVAMLVERCLTTKKSQLVYDYCTTFFAKVTTSSASKKKSVIVMTVSAL